MPHCVTCGISADTHHTHRAQLESSLLLQQPQRHPSCSHESASCPSNSQRWRRAAGTTKQCQHHVVHDQAASDPGCPLCLCEISSEHLVCNKSVLICLEIRIRGACHMCLSHALISNTPDLCAHKRRCMRTRRPSGSTAV